MKTLRLLLIACCLCLASTAYTAEIWRNPGNPSSLYNSGPGMDTWFGNTFNIIAQHDRRLRVGGWGDAYFTLLRFDLSGLPQVATSARIWLFPINEGALTAIQWYQIGSQWHSSRTVSVNFPYATLVNLGRTPAPTLGNWYVIDITVQYNKWRAGTGVLNYGLFLAPVSTNNNFSTFTSSTGSVGFGPWLQVLYTPQANDNVLKLKWPLPTAKPAVPTLGGAFGDDWNNTFCGGLIKKHNGADFPATVGMAVYAAEDGLVRQVLNPSQTGGFAWNIVLEHNHPQGGKYTTVYWHVNPVANVISSNPLGFIPKGMQIGTVADLGAKTHFHFGVRIGAYVPNVSGTGALPQTVCGGFPAFTAGFIDPNNPSNVLFQ